ncbi:ABC transporter permease [Dactylosporangium darangshiense]|uniref:ABC3 transporter permease C-terminal domain-containing protein n=1 Tax=Dactylosporangium darangshiense TaxID=579108 RepID=A0ABP8DJ29_9ACTN
MIRLSGRFRSALIIGLQGIRARKMRTFLSMISLFLGVLAVVTVQAAAETARTLQLADIELHLGKDGTRTIYVPPIGQAMDVTRETLQGQQGVAASYTMQAIIGEPKVKPINPGASPLEHPEMYGGGYGPNARYEIRCDDTGNCRPVPVDESGAAPPGAAIEVMLVAMVNDVRQFRPYRPVSGTWLDFSGQPSYSPRIVINKAAAVGFNRYRIPAEMRIDGATANPTPRIIGVIDDGNEQPMAYARADEIGNWLAPAEPAGATVQQAVDGGSPKEMYISSGPGLEVMFSPTAGETESLLIRKLVAAGVPREALNVNVVDARKNIEQELKILRWIFLGMAGLVLLIGVAGILNVGLATVGERVEEFALRRAVGTPRVLLAGIVLAETLLTGLLTAAAAIGVAAAALDVGIRILGDRVPQLQDMGFPWQAGVAGVIAGLVAGLLGGSIPAMRAARIPIATVMRA